MTMLIILGTVLVSWIVFEILYRMAQNSERIQSLDLGNLLRECAKAAKGSQRRAAQRKLNQYFEQELRRCERLSEDEELTQEQMPLFYLNNACSLYLEQASQLKGDKRKLAQKQMEEAAAVFDQLNESDGRNAATLQSIKSLKEQSVLPSLQYIGILFEELLKTPAAENDETLLLLAGGNV